MTRHPHVHMIVPGGGIALDGTRWISSRPAFLLPVRVLGKLFRRLFLTRHDTGSGRVHPPLAAPRPAARVPPHPPLWRSEEHTSELQSLMRISYAVFCLTKKNIHVRLKNN